MLHQVSNLPGYWDEIDEADPNAPVRKRNRKRDHDDHHAMLERALERRWFGSISSWFQRVTTVSKSSSSSLSVGKTYQANLFNASLNCANKAGTATFAASASIDAKGSANVNVQVRVPLLLIV